MAESVIFPLPDGATYTIPDPDDENWGQNVTDFLVALPLGVPPRSGAFALTGDLSFGATYGLVSNYFKSPTANIATAGIVRLAKTDAIEWRNNANGANLSLAIDGSDNLTFKGSVVAGITYSNWASYTPTIGGAGTPTNVKFYWKQIGDTIFVKGTFNTGTQSGNATISLPNSTSINYSKLSNAISWLGIAGRIINAPFYDTASVGQQSTGALCADGSTTSSVYWTNSNNYAAGSWQSNSGDAWTCYFDYPI